MAEAGCLYHTSWIIDDQPWPINVRGGQKFIYVPYTGQTNDAGMLAWNREAGYFLQMIKDQFDTLYREGAESGRVMCLSLHPHNIGRPNAAKYLDEALRYILGHDGVWNTTADGSRKCAQSPGCFLGDSLDQFGGVCVLGESSGLAGRQRGPFAIASGRERRGEALLRRNRQRLQA